LTHENELKGEGDYFIGMLDMDDRGNVKQERTVVNKMDKERFDNLLVEIVANKSIDELLSDNFVYRRLAGKYRDEVFQLDRIKKEEEF